MRGKNKIWKTIAALFIVSMALASFNIAKVYANTPTVSVQDPTDGDNEFGPKSIGDTFTLNVKVGDPDDEYGWVYGVRGYELILTWNQKMLKLLGPDGTRELGALLEGPFLKKTGRKTFPVAAKSIAGDSVVFTDLITFPVPDAQDGKGTLASMEFAVIGGGETNITLSARLFDSDFNDFPEVDSIGGHWFSPEPFISFTWYVPVAEELPPQENVTVTGMNMGIVVDPDGDVGHVSTTPYETQRPVLSLTDDGVPEKVNMVEGGTMFYGDKIIFDASDSYDLDNSGHRVPLDPANFHWVIRAGGLNTYKGFDFKYESGVELATGPVIDYTFPGDLSKTYTYYGSSHLGFHDLTLTVKDSDNNIATFYTWIRIYRLVPARTININIPNPKHSLKNDGYTMILNGRVQNRGGTGWFPWDALLSYLELARMIHPFVWARMRFDILDLSMNPVKDGTVYSDAIWLRATEQPVGFMSATWTIPEDLSGTYYVKGTGQICGSGVKYGLAVGSFIKPIEILP